MRVVLVGKKYIIKDTLQTNTIEDYWIIDKKKEKKLVNIKVNNGKYELISSNYSKIIDPKCIKKRNGNLIIAKTSGAVLQKVILKENNMYPILIENSKEICILHCLPDYEDSFVHLDVVGNHEITIGSDKRNNIVYKNPLVSKLHAKIIKFRGKWTIENYDTTYGVFVNDFPVYRKEKNIFNGDIIFIMGLQIIIIKDSLYISNPQHKVAVDTNSIKLSSIKNTKVKETQIENDDEIYEEEKVNYYSKSPRLVPQITPISFSIDEPPQLSEERKRPILLALGSSIAMGIMMLLSFSSTIQGIVRGTAEPLDIFMGVMSTLMMLIMMLVLPILELRYDKKSKKKYEEKRQTRYRKYLEEKNETLNELKKEQKDLIDKNYLSSEKCMEVILSDNHRLWERKIDDEDFLTCRIGIGDMPLKIDMQYPEKRFTMVDDNLVSELNKILQNSKTIKKAPITISLREKNIYTIVSNNEDLTYKYMKNLILQLITFHSYEDLKLVFLLNKKTSKEWEYVKMLPYVLDDSKQIRFFADNYEDMNEISKYLTEQLKNRTPKSDEQESENTTIYSPHYLIITDDYRQIQNLGFISSFLKLKGNKGFSLLCITDDMYSVPSRCKTFIDITNTTTGILYDNNNKTNMELEPLITVFYEKIAKKLANIPVRLKNETNSLPSSYTFLDMYNVGNIEQLNILGRWKNHDTTLSLKAPIGVDSNGMIISLDAHEKYHGPHGLIAGSTGSGKSEFIITYILSLALNYHPHYVTFLLIDYKGGGLAGAFKKQNIQLPHLVGTITNIDKNGLERSLISIQSELRRRQAVFNEARDMTDEGTIDIYKYQKLYHEGIVKEPISHLFIICDEFAELKQQEPDFMESLVSVSRIGRSLGVHLILATQKPSGVVDDQIRSNSKFGVCLKVQDTSDSRDIILEPDAAYLKNPGTFYLRVGQNEYFTLGQSGWAGATYTPSDAPVKKIDSSVEFISEVGLPIKKLNDSKQQVLASKGEQLTNLLKYICNLAKKENIKNKGLWLENIPENIYFENLMEKYNVKNEKNKVKVVIGEYDDPANQKQGLIEIDFTQKENVIIYGNQESGKETLLSTLIYGLMTNYTTKQVQMYILDFGTEALKVFRKSPHVGDTVFLGDDEKLHTLFDMIQREIKERKQILSDYNGDYNLYLASGNVMPIIVIIINGYEVFNENYDKYDDLMLTITREGSKSGIMFVMTSNSSGDMRYRMAANFNKKLALQMNNDDDYYSIFDCVSKKRPAHIFGRGLVEIDKEIFEFQTAKICDAADYNEHIINTIKELNNQNQERAMPIPIMPKKIELENVKSYLTDIEHVPIGLIKKNLKVYQYNFAKDFMSIITAKKIDDAKEVFKYIAEELSSLKNIKLNILDVEKVKGIEEEAYKYFEKEIMQDMKNNNDVFTICVIIGISEFFDKDAINEDEFCEFLEKVKKNEKIKFIIIDSGDELEDQEYDEWYEKNIDKSSCIWVGNGMENQSLIDVDSMDEDIQNNCGECYGYVVNQEKLTFIKFIGMEEEGDEDE